ncbi:carbon-nitrogen hydrolase family protein [candidate division KSB1 bacterium]|nr:carbon-nitrogen hydrolase family protein [candidate division KSB1 bacterium]
MGIFTIAIAQSTSFKGNIDANIVHHLKLIQTAAYSNARFIIFPELSLTGYEPELADKLVLSINDTRLDSLKYAARQHDITIVAGAPIRSSAGELHIGSICFFADGSIRTYAKRFLHPGEEKYFSPGNEPAIISVGGQKIGLAICADIANPIHAEDVAHAGGYFYAVSILVAENGYNTDTQLLKNYALKHNMPVFMANHCTETGGYIPAGKSAAWDSQGDLIGSLPDANEALLIVTRATNEWTSEIISV